MPVTWFIILLRHGEAEKNLAHRHGGAGSPLTPEGRRQVAEASSALNCRYLCRRVLTVDRQQCRETADILAVSASRVEPSEVALLPLEPFHLGVLSGLSDEAVADRYPELAMRMKLYREGLLEISDVGIPGASHPAEFLARASAFLAELRTGPGGTWVVGTRSVLVGVVNAALGRTIGRGGGYREIPWQNAGWLVLSQDLRIVEQRGVLVCP